MPVEGARHAAVAVVVGMKAVGLGIVEVSGMLVMKRI